MTYEECKEKFPLGTTFIYGIVTDTEYPTDYYSDFIIPRNINSINKGSIIIFLDTVIGYKTLDNINFKPNIASQWNVKSSEASNFAKSFINDGVDYESVEKCNSNPDYYGYLLNQTYLITDLTPSIFFDSVSKIIIDDFENLDMPGILEGMGIPDGLENLKKDLYHYFYDDLKGLQDADFFEEVLYWFLKDYPYLKNI